MYMSTDTRKVYNVLRQSGIECEPYGIELMSAHFYPNHIISVVEQVLDNGNPKRIEKAKEQGWQYFVTPVYNLLSKRDAAQRKVDYEVGPNAGQVYRLLATSFLLCDFGPQELQIILSELGAEQYQLHDITKGTEAARVSGIRNVFYLRGILTREAQTKAGKTREATQEIDEAEARAWEPPEDYIKLDAGERAEMALDWESRLADIQLSKEFNQLAKNQEPKRTS
jgi:hypothetical protein